MAPRATRTTRQALRLRLATAALALPLLLVIVWAGNPWVGAAAAAAAVVALHEAYTLAAGAGRTVLRWPGMVLGLATVSAALLDGLAVLVVFGAGSVVVFGISLYRRCVADAVRDSLTTVAASAYVALSLAAVVLLRERAMGLEWLLLVFLSVFATDTAAYFVGRVLGRRAMAPSISPGKTWEGALGGLLGGAAAAVALVAVFDLTWVFGAVIGLGLGVSVLAQGGDLLESKAKRLASAKDSGTLFPGHGGLLDRMDSLLPAFVLVYYVAWMWPQ